MPLKRMKILTAGSAGRTGRSSRRLGLWFGLVLGSAAITPVRAEYLVAPDVVVFCEPTLLHALTELGATWRDQTGIPIRIFTSPTWALLGQIAHHARSDLVIGEGEVEAASATERHLIKPATLQHLWRNRLVAAANSASAPGDLASLAGKAPIAIVDPATAVAGAEGKRALQALGLWDAVKSKSIGVVDTADASFLLAEGSVQFALIYATDAAADPDFAVTDTLPPSSYAPIVYWMAEPMNALSPNTAKFVAFLRQAPPDRLRRDGLEALQ